MKKILYITLKDLSILFNDRAAFILMLAAPLVLTLAMGAVSGAFTSTTSTRIESIPVSLVNQDEGPLGAAVLEALSGDTLDGLIEVTEEAHISSLRKQVENDAVAAGIIIPAGYTASVYAGPHGDVTGNESSIEIYINPVRPVTSGIVQAVVIELINGIENGPVEREIQVLVGNAQDPVDQSGTNFMAYMAPGMAVLFLMYTVTQGGRGILAEKQMGTLSRLLSTPTQAAQILAGKVFSVFAAGFLQVSVLIIAAAVLFRLNWGSPLGLILLIAATSAAATGWGVLLASYARNTAQAASLGTAMMLSFGVLGGSFFPISNFSPLVLWASIITPNAWALEGFTILAKGGQPADLLGTLAALLLMTLVLFVSAVAFSRRSWTNNFVQ
jgi:ABC-2 type transport system permease protein